MRVVLFILISYVAYNNAANVCPNGGEIIVRGLTDYERDKIVTYHNNYRLDIANGRVKNQPIGTNLKRMKYSKHLEEGAKVLSSLCIFRHHIVSTGGFTHVGQNIYKVASNTKTTSKPYKRAMTLWFDEHVHYNYTSRESTNNKLVTHYTQMVWHDTTEVGCDFIMFYNKTNLLRPFTKVFTCNYAPGGNWKNEPPYETGTSTKCKKLC